MSHVIDLKSISIPEQGIPNDKSIVTGNKEKKYLMNRGEFL